MDNDIKRPAAALINREWFGAAKGILSDEELGLVLLCAVEYIFGDIKPRRLSSTANTVYAMIRPALDSDITKYLERCERNAANAKSQRQRVAASGTQSQRVAANTTTTTTPTTTTTSTTTISLSPAEIDERDRWLVFGYFWSTGSKAIKEECNAFWSYYESLGWKNNKGAAIVSRLAAARMWKRQFELGVVPNGADAWFKAMQECAITDYSVWQVFAGAERAADKAIVRLRCSGAYLDQLRQAVPTLERTLKALWRVLAIDFETAG